MRLLTFRFTSCKFIVFHGGCVSFSVAHTASCFTAKSLLLACQKYQILSVFILSIFIFYILFYIHPFFIPMHSHLALRREHCHLNAFPAGVSSEAAFFQHHRRYPSTNPHLHLLKVPPNTSAYMHTHVHTSSLNIFYIAFSLFWRDQ